MSLLDEGHHLISELELGIHRFRSHVAQHTWTNIAMDLLDDLITSGQKLKAERASLVTDRDSQKARADKAEADLKTLQDQTAADEAKVKAALAEMSAEVEVEKPAAPVVTTTTTASGALVTSTVDAAAGTTTAVSTDPTTGAATTTVVTHVDGSATSTDASGAAVATDVEAAAAATAAATAAGVAVPSASTDPVVPAETPVAPAIEIPAAS